MGSGGERLPQDSGAKSTLSRAFTSAWLGCCCRSQIRASDFAEQAKKELQQELEIDPANAGAEYVLGELARQAQDLPEAVKHFSKATELETNFADAYLGLGMSFLAQKNYAEAVAPLEKAVKLQPANPAGHYSLATAYARTGRKEDAEREFALQQQTAEHAGGPGSSASAVTAVDRQGYLAPALSLRTLAGARLHLLPVPSPRAALRRPIRSKKSQPPASHITWVHTAGKSPQKYLPETTGAGCAFLDYDNDGWMDIYLVNSGKCDFYNPDPPLRNALYRNNRDGTFTDVTEKAGSRPVATGRASRWVTMTVTVSPICT